MARYIDADKLIETLMDFSAHFTMRCWDDYDKGVYRGLMNATNIIERFQTEDVAPVKPGKLVRVDDNKERCSNCETIYCIYSYPYKRNNYCPNCGAKMEE